MTPLNGARAALLCAGALLLQCAGARSSEVTSDLGRESPSQTKELKGDNFNLKLSPSKAWAATVDTAACDQAARQAEDELGLPSGMLVAIGAVESGHWPWTANFDGVAETYRSKAEAVEALTRARSPRPADVDVGCFQISLHYHPLAFASIAEAFDPLANARYAAHFLLQLRDRYGDWDHAVGAYHSATGPLQVGYREQVFAQWKGDPEVKQPVVASPVEQPRWRVISIAEALQPKPGDHGLPRIITLN